MHTHTPTHSTAPGTPLPPVLLPPEVTDNSITVSWLTFNDSGGCIFYNAYLLQGQTEYQQHNTMGITTPCPSDSSLFCYTIGGLETTSTYGIAIVTVKCASSDPSSVSIDHFRDLFRGRYASIFVTTVSLPTTVPASLTTAGMCLLPSRRAIILICYIV